MCRVFDSRQGYQVNYVQVGMFRKALDCRLVACDSHIDSHMSPQWHINRGCRGQSKDQVSDMHPILKSMRPRGECLVDLYLLSMRPASKTFTKTMSVVLFGIDRGESNRHC